MKIPRIADAISKIDDDLIIESEDKSEKQSKVIWLKVGIAVASLCIIVTGIIIVGNSFIKNNDNTKVNMDTINILDAYGFTLEGKPRNAFLPKLGMMLLVTTMYIIKKPELFTVIPKHLNLHMSCGIGARSV